MCRLWFVGSLFLFAGLVCAVVATALHDWYYLHYLSGDVVWLHVCQAFMIIGVVLNFATLIGALYTALNRVSVKLPRVAAILCAICYLTVVILFASKYKKAMPEYNGTGGHFHAGFVLTIVAIIVDLTGAALVGVGHQDTGYRGL